MRIVLLVLLVGLTGCSPGPPSGLKPGNFAGAGKDRLCIAGAGEAQRAGVIAYAADGAANCTLTGKLEQSGGAWTLTPKGEEACRVTLTIAGEKIGIGAVSQSCAYYCGPRASLAGTNFTRDAKATPAVDLAGDPLC